MIDKQIRAYFGSHIFRFVGAGGMMGAAFFDGTPEGYVVPTNVTVKTYASVVISAGPTAYYQLNETSGSTAVDIIAGNDGAYTGAMSIGQDSIIVDENGYAPLFDGTNDKVVVTSSPTLGNEFALEVWAIASASTPACSLVTEEFAGDYIAFSMGLSHMQGGSPVGTTLGVGFYTGAWVSLESGAIAFPLGRVMHCVGIKTATYLELFVNGVSDAVLSTTTSVVADSDEMYIGMRHTEELTTPYFNGQLDEVALYASALTHDQIRRHYAYGLGYIDTTYPYQVITDGAQYDWRLNEATGSATYSEVNHPVVYDGTMTGGVTVAASAIFAQQAGSMVFDGTNDLISLPAIDALTSATYEITLQSASAVTDNRFLAFNAQAPYTLCRYVNASSLEFRINATGPEIIIASAITQTDALHFVGSYKQSGGMSMYLNGVLMAEGSAPASFNQVGSDQKNHIGADRTPTDYFDGSIGEVAIYPTQLNAAQIREHYAYSKYTSDTYPFRVIMDGAIGYWRLNEASSTDPALNEMGVGFDGTYSGGTTHNVSSLIDNGGGTAVTFDGASGVVTLDSAPRISERLTLEAWVVCETSSPGVGILTEEHTGSGRVQYEIGTGTSANTGTGLSFGHFNGVSWHVVSAGVPFPLNETVHTVGVVNGNVFSIYGNAVLLAEVTATTSIVDAATDKMFIGRRHDLAGPSNFWDGTIDEAAVYATALTAETVREHYAHGKGFLEGTYPFEIIKDGATHYYRLAGSSATDQVSEVGVSPALSVSQVSKISAEVSGLLEGGDNTAVYFSAAGVSALAISPTLYTASATTQAAPIRTMETWFSRANDANQSEILGLYASTTNRAVLRVRASDRKLSTFSGATSTDVLESTASIAADTTYHAVLTYDGSISSLYLDGELVQASALHVGGMDAAARLNIGGVHFAGVEYGGMYGTVDEVAVYTTALTSTIVRKHYQLGIGGTTYKQAVLDSDPFMYWQLGGEDDAIFSSVVDQSGLNSELKLVRASANVSTLASSLVVNDGDSGRSLKFQQTGIGSVSLAMYETSAIVSAAVGYIKSWETWFKVDDESASRHLVCCYNSDTDRMLVRRFTGNKVGVFDGVNSIVESPASSVNAGEVHHTVVTWDETTTRLYLDGILVDASAVDPGGTTSSRTQVGGYKGSGGLFGSMSGWIDEVAVYKHVLPPEEIKRHYKIGSLQFDS